MRYAVYGGHGSWAVAVIFLLTIALRAATGNRRRSGRRRPPVSSSAFEVERPGPPGHAAAPATAVHDTAAPSTELQDAAAPGTAVHDTAAPDTAAAATAGLDTPAPVAAAPRRDTGRGGSIGSSGVPAGWLVDPTGRHQLRYWSGSAWTEHVSDGGVPATDVPPNP